MENKNNLSSVHPEKCEICNERDRLYSCPRCNVQYCSVTCYKSKNHAQCSEQFYEQCVKEEVSSMGGDSEAAKKMAEILNKMRQAEELDDENEDEEDEQEIENDSDDEDSDNSVDDRFAAINLEDGEEIWNSLTEEERQKFVQSLGDGHILQVVPEWIPWWASESDELPEMAQNIPPLSQLTKVPASPNLPAIVLNTLCSYLTTCRLLKGEVHGFCVEAATAILEFSRTLRGGADVSASCTSFTGAIRLLENDIQRKMDWFVSSGFQFDVELLNRDLDCIKTHGSKYVLLALSDIQSILQEAIDSHSSKISQKRFTGSPPTKQAMKIAQKKITFYIAWTKETSPQVWDGGELITELTEDE